MSTKSAPFYWLECDHDGCTKRCPNGDGDYLAMVTVDQAKDDASESDWALNHNGTGKDYCFDHVPHGCDCDLLEKPELPTTCEEFRPNPMTTDYCAICGHLEECHE